MTLEEWLDFNIRYLEAAVQDVPAKGDLQPFFAAMKDDEPLIFGLDLTRVDKDRAVNFFQAGLRAMDARSTRSLPPPGTSR